MSDINRVRDVKWLTPGLKNSGQVVGLVLYECEFGGHKGYVSVCRGEDERFDVQHIIDWGGRIPDSLAATIWPKVEVWYDSQKDVSYSRGALTEMRWVLRIIVVLVVMSFAGQVVLYERIGEVEIQSTINTGMLDQIKESLRAVE